MFFYNKTVGRQESTIEPFLKTEKKPAQIKRMVFFNIKKTTSLTTEFSYHNILHHSFHNE